MQRKGAVSGANERTHHIGDTVFVISRKYTDLAAIGKGSYGVVCSAIDNLTKKKVAIKKITPVVKHIEDAKHVLREIRLMRYLGVHENIISLEDLHIRESADELYIIMELFDTDLHRVISSKQPLTESHFKHFFFQLLCGVKYMHMNRIIHRDLKPANLLVSRDCKLRITDFGLARERPSGRHNASSEDSIDDPMTEHVVTRWYRACELMLLPDGLYTYAVDMWACGCILGEMIGRKPMFPGKNFIHQLTLILDVIGCPRASEVAHIRNSQARKFLDAQVGKVKKPLNAVFPSASLEVLELMDGLLAFSPNNRIDVDEALSSAFLLDAGGSSRKLCLNFPKVDSRFEFEFERSHATKAELKELVLEEVLSFKGKSSRKLPTPPIAAADVSDVAMPSVPSNERVGTSPRYAQDRDIKTTGAINERDDVAAVVHVGDDRDFDQQKQFSVNKERLIGPSKVIMAWAATAETKKESDPAQFMARLNSDEMSKKSDDAEISKKLAGSLRSPSRNIPSSPMKEFARVTANLERMLSTTSSTMNESRSQEKLSQLLSPARPLRENLVAESKSYLLDKDNVLMRSREHKESVTAYLESVIEKDNKKLGTTPDATPEFIPEEKASSYAGVNYAESSLGQVIGAGQVPNAVNCGSNVPKKSGNHQKKPLTVPKAPTFSTMSWQRKHAEFEQEDAAGAIQKQDDKTKPSNIGNLLRPTISSQQRTTSASGSSTTNVPNRSSSNPRGRVEKKKNYDGMI